MELLTEIRKKLLEIQVENLFIEDTSQELFFSSLQILWMVKVL